MGKPKQDDNDEDMKDLADASDDAAKEAGAPDESAMKQAKKAKRAGDKADDDAKADDGYDDEDLYQDGSNDNFEEASKNKSQPHLRPSGKAKASTPTAAEPKGGDKSLREAVDLLASDNRRLAEQVRELKLKERKAEVKDQIRQLSDGKTRFAKPVVEEFEKLALADSKAGDKAFALLKQVKATGLIDLAEKGRSSDVEDELNDPYSIDDKVLSDSNGHAIVGQGLVERAQRYCAEQKLDWEDLADRTKAITAVTKSRTAGVDNGIKRD